MNLTWKLTLKLAKTSYNFIDTLKYLRDDGSQLLSISVAFQLTKASSGSSGPCPCPAASHILSPRNPIHIQHYFGWYRPLNRIISKDQSKIYDCFHFKQTDFKHQLMKVWGGLAHSIYPGYILVIFMTFMGK